MLRCRRINVKWAAVMYCYVAVAADFFFFWPFLKMNEAPAKQLKWVMCFGTHLPLSLLCAGTWKKKKKNKTTYHCVVSIKKKVFFTGYEFYWSKWSNNAHDRATQNKEEEQKSHGDKTGQYRHEHHELFSRHCFKQ